LRSATGLVDPLANLPAAANSVLSPACSPKADISNSTYSYNNKHRKSYTKTRRTPISEKSEFP